MKHVFDNIWRGLVLPRVEMLAWFALTGGMNNRDVLLRKGVIRQGEEGCVLCDGATETELRNALQFLLEDMNVDGECISLVSSRRDIMDWINDKEKTSWDSRFLRNKAMNKNQVFKGVEVIFRQEKEFKKFSKIIQYYLSKPTPQATYRRLVDDGVAPVSLMAMSKGILGAHLL
ncbi:hypothetical protein PIB30_074489 [Stylosanthes scabra]|uniref:Uncharacterized protein n=1 Tax=Stylosanthes scabra TaxID=79078 RepID=A0ABU6RPJ7_9FABA|nr:hypothetical protein [Stylosanthes scabra]